MPRLIGRITADKWEREVRRELASQLPSDWIVVCNVSWTYAPGGDRPKDGQSDFVILVPELGMAILEVKGSRGVRVADDGIWYRQEIIRRTGQVTAETAIDEPPPEQASRNMYTLARIVSDRLPRSTFPGVYAYLVAYPNGKVAGEPSLFDRTTIVDSRDIHRLASRIKQVLVARTPDEAGRSEFTAEMAARVAAILGNVGFQIEGHDTPLDAREDTTSVEELTRQQFAALRGAFELPRVAVTGPAGSGKTLMALWKLEALLEEGRRAVYVCYNKSLAEHLQRTHPGMATSIINIDKLFASLVKVPSSVPVNYFLELLPSSVQDFAFQMPLEEKYDDIIVDEGQDFGQFRLMALLELLVEEGQWLVFADWSQNVYRAAEQALVGAEVTFRLFHNCRNTKSVNTAANKYCEQSIESLPGAPLGVPPMVRKTSLAVMAAAVWEAAHNLAPEGGVVVLSPFRLENSCLKNARKAYRLELTEDLSKLGAPGYVLFSTVRSFKGLEANNVVLVHADIPNRSDAFSEDDLYVACTRATGRLAIVTCSEEAGEWYADRIGQQAR